MSVVALSAAPMVQTGVVPTAAAVTSQTMATDGHGTSVITAAGTSEAGLRAEGARAAAGRLECADEA